MSIVTTALTIFASIGSIVSGFLAYLKLKSKNKVKSIKKKQLEYRIKHAKDYDDYKKRRDDRKHIADSADDE